MAAEEQDSKAPSGELAEDADKKEPLPTPVSASESKEGSKAAQMAALYVGDLHPDVTEVVLYETFSSAGNVASCRVCRDNVTRRSLGYAYVNYFNIEDAQQALKTLNYTQIKGRSIRIMWSQRDSSVRKNTASNLIVKHLDDKIDNKGLHDMFNQFGTILSCKVQTDMVGKSKGYGFVHFETEEAAKKATDELNGKQVGSSTLFVGAFMTRQELQAVNSENYTNLYVKHLPQDWDETKLNEVFSEYGELQSAVVQATTDGKRFALINFRESAAAKKAVDSLHRKDMRPEGVGESEQGVKDDKDLKESEQAAATSEKATDAAEAEDVTEGEKKDKPESAKVDDFPEHLLYVQRAQTREERTAALKEKPKKEAGKGKGKGGTAGDKGQAKIAVRNLPDSMTLEKLRELFQPYGTLVSAVEEAAEDDPRVGYIVFSTAAEAAKAVEEMHEKTVDEKVLSVTMEKRKRPERDGPEKKGGREGKGKGRGGKSSGKAAPPPAQMRPGMPMSYGMPFPPAGMPLGGARPPQMGIPGMPPVSMPLGRGMPTPVPLAYSLPPAFAGIGRGAPSPAAGSTAAPGASGVRPQAAYTPAQVQAMQMQMQAAMAAAMGRGMPAGAMPGAPRPGLAPPGAQVPVVAGQAGPPSTEALSALSPAAQKQVLGERLFPLVQRRDPNLAGKITGMLLELPNSDLVALLKSDAALQKKVDEAVNVLQKQQKG
mmetsp:Transcript_23951/g.43983  ORF Transcript_23951/g.43983 Transcript_23951/m.43983 type:complete len:713 (+) Transcript_23951:132-2270(+)